MSKKSIYLLPLCSLLLVLNGCSSLFGTHAYNDDFGLLENRDADKQLEKEEMTSKEELQKFEDEAKHVTEFKPEKGTFLAENYRQVEPIITYLYPFDPKFYSEDELPENKGRVGNVVPSSIVEDELSY